MKDTKDSQIHKIKTKQLKKNQGTQRQPNKPKEREETQPPAHKICKFCERKHQMKKEDCPAWGQRCNNCNERNHFKSQCKKVSVLETNRNYESDDSGDSWLKTIENPNKKENISALMMVNDCEIRFQLDSGANVNTIQKKYVRRNQVTRGPGAL